MLAQGEKAVRPAKSGRTGHVTMMLVALLACLVVAACGGRRTTNVKLPPPINPRVGWTQVGVASWYGPPFHGRRASNGEIYDMNKLTAAHKRLPFDTWLRVKNLSNGKTTEVRITDRGPFVGKRIIDLSKAAAAEIGMLGSGVAKVRLTLIRPPKGSTRAGAAASNAKPASRRQAGRFDIQIGFFEERENANALAAKARGRGHRTSVRRTVEGGSQRFQVLVAGGNARQANARLRTLQRQGFEGFLHPRRD
ncbi:MAG: septal ring lytic transglycosylase RlpA family protein [Acidobacteriia bacterium]|nr:septal ring lytic transglycosylase RlpA family protein [Terriglobia bacterium]